MAKKGDSIMATELLPGANHYINCEPQEPEPPNNFVDPNTYSYRLRDGQIRLRGIMLGPRSVSFPFNSQNLSCFRTEEERRDTVKDTSINWEEIIKDGMELVDKGATPYGAAVKLKAKYDLPVQPQSIYPKIKKALKKRGKSEHADANKEPDEQIIINPEFEAAVKEMDRQQPAATEGGIRPEKIADILKEGEETATAQEDDTKIYTPPQRQNYTISQYEEQLKHGGFTEKDNEPIPFRPVIDLAPMKLALIRTVIDEQPDQELPSNIVLNLIGAIKDLEVGA